MESQLRRTEQSQLDAVNVPQPMLLLLLNCYGLHVKWLKFPAAVVSAQLCLCHTLTRITCPSTHTFSGTFLVSRQCDILFTFKDTK
jgi:hypothetical protein